MATVGIASRPDTPTPHDAPRLDAASRGGDGDPVPLGVGVAASERAVSFFRNHDEAQLEEQYAVHHDEGQLIQTSQQAAAQLQSLFEADAVGPLATAPGTKAAAGNA